MTSAPSNSPPPGRLTPECRVGRLEPSFRYGCPACPAPGYQHPVLGWLAVPCVCECHRDRGDTT